MKKTLTTIALVLTSALLATAAVDRVNSLQASTASVSGPQLQQLQFSGTVMDVIDSTTCLVRADGVILFVNFPDRFYGNPGSEIDLVCVSQGILKYEGNTLRSVLAQDWK